MRKLLIALVAVLLVISLLAVPVMAQGPTDAAKCENICAHSGSVASVCPMFGGSGHPPGPPWCPH